MSKLLQKELISRVKEKGIETPCVNAIMMYGSFTHGCGDAFSDIEFYIFIDDEFYKDFNSKEWVSGISPFYTSFYNEFGTEVFIFKSLIRGEFHFLAAKEMPIIETFATVGYFPDVDAMCLHDRNGRLQAHLNVLKSHTVKRETPENIESVINNCINSILFGINVLKRGEIARSLECLWFAQKYYLQLVRIQEGTTKHWVNPTKCLEKELSPASYQVYKKCTSNLDIDNLRSAHKGLLSAADNTAIKLSSKYKFHYESELFQALTDYIND
jgi:lincosamide nucleotidyltransferase